jgi:branched-chain amino acid transport system ATP-binding protein
MSLLRVKDLSSGYKKLVILREVGFAIDPNEILTIIGPNGSGKTTLMRTICGFIRPQKGTIELFNRSIVGLRPNQVVNLGLSYVPEERGIFKRMTVYENLQLGGYLRRDPEKMKKDLDSIFEKFPILQERRDQVGRTLSGGEQQILAIARALFSNPEIILMDEPSNGLAPLMIRHIFEIIRQIHLEGKAILLVEQNAKEALLIASRGLVLENGRIVMEGKGQDLLANKDLIGSYLGGKKSNEAASDRPLGG